MGIVSVARYVVVLDYKPDSGSVNGDKDGRHIPLTALSSGRRVSRVLPTAFVPEVVAMAFHRREIQTERRRQARSLFQFVLHRSSREIPFTCCHQAYEPDFR